jgi:hypothetical protein
MPRPLFAFRVTFTDPNHATFSDITHASDLLPLTYPAFDLASLPTDSASVRAAAPLFPASALTFNHVPAASPARRPIAAATPTPEGGHTPAEAYAVSQPMSPSAAHLDDSEADYTSTTPGLSTPASPSRAPRLRGADPLTKKLASQQRQNLKAERDALDIYAKLLNRKGTVKNPKGRDDSDSDCAVSAARATVLARRKALYARPHVRSVISAAEVPLAELDGVPEAEVDPRATVKVCASTISFSAGIVPAVPEAASTETNRTKRRRSRVAAAPEPPEAPKQLDMSVFQHLTPLLVASPSTGTVTVPPSPRPCAACGEDSTGWVGSYRVCRAMRCYHKLAKSESGSAQFCRL